MTKKQETVHKALKNIAIDVEQGKYNDNGNDTNTSVLLFVLGTVFAEIDK